MVAAKIWQIAFIFLSVGLLEDVRDVIKSIKVNMSVIAGSTIRRAGDPKKISPGHKSLDAELYGLGHTLRHLQPPGGRENGVFDAYKLPPEVLTPTKKVREYLKSNIFEQGEASPPRPITPASQTTQHRLFSITPPQTVQASHNHLKSTVFEPDPPKKPPSESQKKNPVTGENCSSTDERKNTKKGRVVRNPITFEGVADNGIRSRCTQPPGGKCTLVLEYIE